MINSILKALFAFVVVFGIAYFLTGFISTDFNVFNWTNDARLTLTTISVITFIIALIVSEEPPEA